MFPPSLNIQTTYSANIAKDALLQVHALLSKFLNYLEIAERHIPNCKNIFHRPKPPNMPVGDSNLTNTRSKNDLSLLKKTELITKYSTYYKGLKSWLWNLMFF